MDYNTKIVIFCYHRFDSKNNAYSISKKNLETHIKTALEKGYNLISENDIYDFYYNQVSLKPLNFMITIDDGFKDILKNAYPIFKTYEIKPSILINSEMVGNKVYLSWDDMLELIDFGITIGNHSGGHFNYMGYRKKSDKDIDKLLREQIIDSDKIINEKLGEPSLSYAHPYGIFENRIVDIAREKYKLIYTTNKGPNIYETDPLYLKRYVIDTTSDKIVKEYFDYELLPIVGSYPEDGGIFQNGDKISFNFESSKDVDRFKNFYFQIKNYKFRAYIDNDKVYMMTDKLKLSVFSLSLFCEDNYGNKYINSITLNKKVSVK